MSAKNVRDFYEKVEQDKELQEQIKILWDEFQAQRETKIAKLLQLASNAGFEFTSDDLSAAREDNIAKLPTDELRQLAKRIEDDPLTCMPGYTYER